MDERRKDRDLTPDVETGRTTKTSVYHGEFGEAINEDWMRAIPRLSGAALQDRLDRSTVLDVRSGSAYASSRSKIPGAIRVDTGNLDWIDSQPRLASYVIYDDAGGEAAMRVAQHMISRGFDNVFVLEGGWAAWEREKFPADNK